MAVQPQPSLQIPNQGVPFTFNNLITQAWFYYLQKLQSLLSQPGDIKYAAYATVPSGWLVCNGVAVSRTTYGALFAAIGTTWGNGDGSTTFSLPDLTGTFPLGANTAHTFGTVRQTPNIVVTTGGGAPNVSALSVVLGATDWLLPPFSAVNVFIKT